MNKNSYYLKHRLIARNEFADWWKQILVLLERNNIECTKIKFISNIDTKDINGYEIYDKDNSSKLKITISNDGELTFYTDANDFIIPDSIGVKDVNGVDIYNIGFFKSLINVKDIDCTNINTATMTNMCELFADCYKLEKINVKNFNTSNVKVMNYMFDGTQISSIDLSSFDTSKVELMNGMFHQCHSLEKLDLSNFNTKNVIYMQDMFNECRHLRELNISSFNTKKVVDMSRMFRQCPFLKKLDLSHFDTSNVKDMSCIFEDNDALDERITHNLKIPNVIDKELIFEDNRGRCSETEARKN